MVYGLFFSRMTLQERHAVLHCLHPSNPVIGLALGLGIHFFPATSGAIFSCCNVVLVLNRYDFPVIFQPPWEHWLELASLYNRVTGHALDSSKIFLKLIPHMLCMVYLPAFVWFLRHMLVNILYMSIWVSHGTWWFSFILTRASPRSPALLLVGWFEVGWWPNITGWW